MGSGLTGNLTGLLTEATAFNRHVGGDTWADTIRRAITQVQLARGVASGVVIHPTALEHIELQKDGQDRYVMELEVTDNNGRTVLWRLPTVATDAIGATSFLVADFARACRLYDRQQTTVQIGFVNDDLVKNLLTFLAERRLALTVPRPDLLIRGVFGES